MKKFVGIILVAVLIITVPIQAFASSQQQADVNKQGIATSSFLDSEGKVNTIKTTILSSGKVHSEHYIDGKLFNSVDALTTNGEEINVTLKDSNNTIEHKVISASDILYSNNYSNTPSASPRSFSYAGRIKYRPLFDYLGNSYYYMLSIYQEQGSSYNTYKTINATQGTLVNIIVSSIAAVLSVVFPPLAALAQNLFYAAAYAVGVSIVGGAIQNSITKTYYVRNTPYSIRAVDSSTSRSRTYQGASYRVFLDGGGYSSETFYEGYMPWNSETVAYWMYSDFWSETYPGVESYS